MAHSRGSSARRDVLAWAMYDWANSAYSTLSITVLVNYIKDVLPGDAGTLVWSYGIGTTMLLAAVLSPILGAVADAHASKHRWLAGTALTGASAVALMVFATPDRAWLLVLLFVIGHFSYELSWGFYNGFLPDVADEDQMGRVSAWGFAAGYVGGGLALALVIVLLLYGPLARGEEVPVPESAAQTLLAWGQWLGLPSESGGLSRLGLLFTGLWWGLFSLPTLLILRDRRQPRREKQRLTRAARQAFGEVKRTLRNIRSYRILALFLLAFLIYNDGVQTVITQASVFAREHEQIAMSTMELGLVILMVQFVAWPGAMLIGWLADRVGQKPMLIVCLVIWGAILSLAFFITTTAQFWGMAVVVALVLGGTQSVSRAVMGQMTPRQHSAEFFGFFNLSGKATSMFGPIFFGTVLAATESPNLALTSLLIFFIAGLVIVALLDFGQGRRQARGAEGTAD